VRPGGASRTSQIVQEGDPANSSGCDFRSPRMEHSVDPGRHPSSAQVDSQQTPIPVERHERIGGSRLRVITEAKRIVTRLNSIGVTLAAIGMFAMVVMIVCETLSRYLFRAPFSWAIELPSYAMTFSTALALAFTQEVRGHIAVEVVEEFFSDRAKAKLGLFLYPTYLAVVLFITAASFRLMKTSFTEWRLTEVMRFPLFIPHSFIFCGFVVLCLQLLLDLGQTISKVRRGGKRDTVNGER
jgi:TRAP-type C4-dicarboxylate transport system permease small subunit